MILLPISIFNFYNEIVFYNQNKNNKIKLKIYLFIAFPDQYV